MALQYLLPGGGGGWSVWPIQEEECEMRKKLKVDINGLGQLCSIVGIFRRALVGHTCPKTGRSISGVWLPERRARVL